MKIVSTHSHLNGLEFLVIRQPGLWAKIQKVIEHVDANLCMSKSSNLTENEEILYNPLDLKSQINTLLRIEGWRGSQNIFAAASDHEDDLVKDRVAVEVQFGKNSVCDLFAKHLTYYVCDQIDVGVEILPTKCLQSKMSNDTSFYEGELSALIRNRRGVPSVPLVILGIEP